MKLESFFENLKKSKKSLLMIDYDGILAPFKVNRNEAGPEKKLVRMLEVLQLTGKCLVVVVSGRALDDLIPLLCMDPLPQIWGSHGLERLDKNGERSSYQLSHESKGVLKKESVFLKTIGMEKEVEEKPFSIAVHWQGKSKDDIKEVEKRLRSRWQSLEKRGFEMYPFNHGLELRPKGRGKGEVIHYLLAHMPAGIPCAYIGDDLTDEDAFLALGDRGLKVLLRHHNAPTLADMEMKNMEELSQFLENWIEAL